MGELYFFLAAILVTGLAAWFDWRTGEIPNWLTLGALGAGLIGHAVSGGLRGGWSEAGKGLLFSLAGMGVCAFVPFLLFRSGAIGGGDVKLLAALGALLRPMVGIEAELYSFIVAALYAPARLAYEGKLLKTLGNTVLLTKNVFVPKQKRQEVPREMMAELRFAPSVFVATIVAVILHWRA
jgi:prepilin peptidase CpaA